MAKMFALAALLSARASFGQAGPDTLALSSGTAASNGTVALNLVLTSPSGSGPAGIQWTLTYPTSNVVSISLSAGAAATAAAKTLTCSTGAGTYTCVLSGMNQGVISNGTVAVVNLTMAVGVSTTAVGVTNTVASSPAGAAIPLNPTGGTVTGGALPSVSSLSCNPGTLNTSSNSTCTVTLNGPAPSGGAAVTLTNTNTSLTVPASATVAAGTTSVNFTISTGTVNSNQNVTITASYNQTSANTTVSLAVTQYQLTTSAAPAAGGTVTPASGGSYNAGTVVNLTATAASGYQFSSWTGPVANANSASTTVTMSAAETVTANFVALTGITIQTSPTGLQFSVDGGAAQTAPQTLSLAPGTHTIAVVTTQAGATGTQYVFASWSDGGAASHSITVTSSAATYTASFTTQYQLTTLAAPAAGGTVTPATGAYYNSGTVVNLSATAASGYQFGSWSGSVAAANSASTTVTMSAPETVAANFTALTGITIQTNPTGLKFSVDGGAAQTAPQTLSLAPGTHTIAVVTTQAGATGTQYVFASWSDGGSASHSITVTSSAATYAASFTTQYQLTTSAAPAAGGTVTPATGAYYNSGTVVNLSATAASGYQFSNWTGPVANANSASTTVTMSAAETVTANFVALTGITIQTSPTGLQFSVDGGAGQTAPQTLSLAPGTHTIAVVTTQAGATGTQYVFASWSDGGAASHSITVTSSAATYTASFTTQYQLTTLAAPAAGGTVTPASGAYYNSGTVVNLSATAASGYQFSNWTGPVANANSASTTVTMSAAETVTANFVALTGITIQTSPTGLQFSVDGGAAQTAPQTLSLAPGSHTIAVVTTQAGAAGTQYVFASWNDGGAASHSITVTSSAATYAASFTTQYQLTTSAAPAAGGTVTPATGAYYNSGTVVNLSATAASGYQFSNWTGPVANANSASTTVTMSAAETVTANFVALTGITIQTNPTGLQFSVDGGAAQTALQTLSLAPGTHTIAVVTTQVGATGTQYVFASWSDGGTASHSITVTGSAATYTASFTTQYQLTTSAAPAAGGTVTPAAGAYYNSGTVVNLSATAASGYQFSNWTGSVAAANSASTTVTMSAPETVSANFTALTGITIQTSPTGLQFWVDGGAAQMAPQTISLAPGTHTIAVVTTQAGAAGTQYVFASWSDGGAASHSITVTGSAATYTASFTTQYQLTMAVSPAGSGSATPASPGFYTAGTPVSISATPGSGFNFVNWTGGSVTSASSASTTVTLSAATALTANFQAVATTQVSSLGCTLTSLGANSNTTCTVTLSQAAPTGGTNVTLTNTNTTLTVPGSVLVAWGGTSATFNISTNTLSTSGSATVTATLGTSSSSVTISLVALVTPASVSCSPTSLTAGGSSTCTVTLNKATVGLSVLSVASNSANVTVPSGLVIATGTTGNFTASAATTITGNPAATITVTLNSVSATTTISLTTGQYQLATSASPAAGGTVTPASGGSYSAGTVVNLTATAATGYQFSSWSGPVANANSASTTVTMSAAETVTANFTALTGITIQTNPTGLKFSVDGGAAQTAPQTISLAPGTHTIAVVTTQAGAAGTQYLFASWSDGGAASHSITVTGSAASYTASFTTQYQLTTAASPAAGGTVTPATGAYYNSGTVVNLSATAASGYQFGSWSGSVAAAYSSSTPVTMSAPETATANFTALTGITIQTNPAGLQFSVDGGAAQTAPQTISLAPGTHTIAVVTTQAGAAGTQYVFASWSDGGAASHSITVTSSTATYTASFTTQYQLTTSASPAAGGTVTPATGAYYNSGTVVNLSATATSGYQFSNWTGSVAAANSASTTVTMSAPETVAANFTALTGITFQTSPTGLKFSVDGGAAQTAPQTISLAPGTHTIAVVTTQAGAAGTQYVFTSWSDGGAASHSITVNSSAATYTASFTTQYQLTTAASPTAGGTVTPASGSYYNSGTVVNLSATAASGYQFGSWSGSVAVANSASTTVTMSAPETVTANFTALTGITIQTNPSGLQFTVDGGAAQTAPQTISLVPGAHTIAVVTTQPGAAGTQYVFASWSDGGAASHSITVTSSAATYTASFTTQYQLTTSASPAAGGTVTPATGSYYNSGTVVNLSATAASGYQFGSWTGSVANANSASTTVTMSAPETVTANFTALTGITIQTNPTGLKFSVDGGAAQTAPQTISLAPGTHTIAVVTTQAGAAGTQYVFASWSDGGAASHSITVTSSAANYTASFTTQYQLTTAAAPAAGGTVTPATGAYYNSGTVVNLSATAASGYQFSSWTGSVAAANSASTTVTMSAPETVTANFTALTGITIQTNPSGLQFTVDGGAAQTAPQTISLAPGTHTIAVVTTQAGAAGTQYVLASWSDGGAASHSITVTGSAATYTASFTTQYQLTTAASPAAGGAVTPATGTYYNSGTGVNLTATAATSYQFSSWTGSVANANSTSTTVTMSAPETVTANFTALTGITIQTNPAGLQIQRRRRVGADGPADD